MIGTTLGNYRIVEQIGMGGMATVYKAYDASTDRYVAVKVLPQHYSQDPMFVERFRREAKAIAKLEHINILPVHAYGEEDGTAYMVMRYLETGTLTELLKQRSLSLEEASRLLSQMAGALDHAHRNGIIHRDVKPSNVLIDAEGNAFLTDFGIAKIVGATLQLTGTGAAIGTPQYMSPEQCRGVKDLTSASDIYSLGIVLYLMLTGRVPFDAETPLAVIHQHLNEPLPPPRSVRPDLPEDVERVILKALAKQPEQRYESAAAMSEAFTNAIVSVPAVTTQPASPTVPTMDIPIADARTSAGSRRIHPALVGLFAVLVVGGLAAAAVFTGIFSPAQSAEESAGDADSEAIVAEAGAESEQAATPTQQTDSSAPTATEVVEYVEGEVLFEDDFEDGDLDGWILRQVGWNVVQDETSNLVLQGTGSDDRSTWRSIYAGDSQWRNYAHEARVRIVEFGSPPFGQGFSFEFRNNLRADCNFYELLLNDTFVSFYRANDCNFDNLAQLSGFVLPIDTWFTTRVEVTNDFFRGYVDGLLMLESEADDLFQSGGISFKVPPTNTVWFDDVRVVELVPASEAAAETSTDNISFRDDFDQPALTEGWSWVREDSSLWSLSDQDGSLNIVAGESYMLFEGGDAPLLLRDVPQGDFELRTLVIFSPTENFQSAGLIVYEDDDRYIGLVRAFCGLEGCVGEGAFLDDDQRFIAEGLFPNQVGGLPTGQPVHLRLVREGNVYTGYWSRDGETWIYVAETSSDITPVGVGLYAGNSGTGVPAVLAYFDSFEIRELSP